MKKKFYIIPQVEQLECRLFDALCTSDMPDNSYDPEQGLGAPRRRVF